MVKRRRDEIDSGGATETEDATTSYKTVFIDTNLDTHLAVIVSHSDTVSDIKKKIVFEHLRCFPGQTELKISSVKVKRKGHYYHLPDTMLVRSVFEGTKNGWFLSVDASRFQCLENDQGLLCIAHRQIEAENLLPCDSFNVMDKQKAFDTTESYPGHGNFESGSVVKQKEVAGVIGEFKSVKPMDNSQQLSPRSGPLSKKRKIKHKDDGINLPITGTSKSNHGKDNDSEFKIVGNDTMLTNANQGERDNINMKLVNVSAEPLINQCSNPSNVPKLGMRKNRLGGASAEISGVQDELHGNRSNDTLGETSHSKTVANKVKILDSKECSRGSTEFNHRDISKMAIPENSTAGKPIKVALAEEMLEDQSLRTDTANKKRKKSKKKKGEDSSTCYDEVGCMVLGSTDKFEGIRGLQEKGGVEMKIFDKLTDVDSTIHVTQSRLKETSLVKDHVSNKECPASVSKDVCEMNLVGRPILESIVSGDDELGTDVANTTGEHELIPNCDDPSTRDPVPSHQLGDLQGAAENSFGRKRSRAKKSTSHQRFDMENIVGASQNACDQDIVRSDGSSDAATKVDGMPKNDVDPINEIEKEGKLSVSQGAETSLPSDNNEATGATKEQVICAKRALNDKGNIESRNASSMNHKKKSRKKSAEKIPDKLDGEDESRVNCSSLAAGIGSTADPVTEQSKKGEILFGAEGMLISLNTEVKGSPHNKDLVQVQSATCRSSEAVMTIKEVETISATPSNVKVAEGHGNSGRSKKKKPKMDVSNYINDVLYAPSAMQDPSANHFVQESNQHKNALPASKREGALEQVPKSAYAAGSHLQVEKATCIEAELLPVEEKGNEVEHLLLNQTDKNQETLSIAEKRRKTKTKMSQSSKKSKSSLSIQDQEGSHKDLAASNDNLEDVNPLSEPMEMDESGKNSRVDQLAGTKSAYAAGSHHQVEKATCIEAKLLPVEEKGNEVEHLLLNQTDKNQETLSIAEKKQKTKTRKSQSSKKSKSSLSIQDQEGSHKELAASNHNLEDVNPLPEPMEMDESGKNSHVDQLAGTKSAYAAGSHHQVEKTTCIEAKLLSAEEKGNEVEHLLLNQTDKNQETLSIAEKKQKTKTRQSQSSKKSKSSLSIEDQEGSHKDLAASNDNLEDVNPLPEPVEMDESGKYSHVDQLAGTKLENQSNSGIHSNFESSTEAVRNADSFQVPSHTLIKGALEEMHVSDVNSDKSEGINFKQYFVPGQQGEVASKKPMTSNRDTKASRKSKDGMTSGGFSEDTSKSRIELALLSRSSAQGDKTLEKAGKLATFDAPANKKKSEESMDESTSSSSSKGSDKFPEDNRWQTGSEIQSLFTRNTKMRTGNIEDFIQPKKGLIPKPGPKFGDSRSRRSESKEGGKSDSTTETTSDSSSSDSSVEGSEISQASTPKGANVAKSDAAAAKHKLKSNILGEAITMEMILKSSSRFKKAKVTAAQCEDEESQPVDVVPDSLADTQNR